MKIRQHKMDVLKQIYNSYEEYAGKSNLELKIEEISVKISKEDAEILRKAFEQYKNHFFTMMANTKRVYINLKQNIKIDNLDKVFKDIEELEELK